MRLGEKKSGTGAEGHPGSHKATLRNQSPLFTFTCVLRTGPKLSGLQSKPLYQVSHLPEPLANLCLKLTQGLICPSSGSKLE